MSIRSSAIRVCATSVLLALASATTAGPAAAQAMMCTEALPPGMESWVDPIFLKGGDSLPIGTAARVTLTRGAKLAVAPEKTPTADAYGGMLRFQVTTAGRYRVSLGGPVWIDVVRGSRRLNSVAHEHGGKCSRVKKMVDFIFSPGSYALELSGAQAAIVGVFVGPVR